MGLFGGNPRQGSGGKRWYIVQVLRIQKGQVVNSWSVDVVAKSMKHVQEKMRSILGPGCRVSGITNHGTAQQYYEWIRKEGIIFEEEEEE